MKAGWLPRFVSGLASLLASASASAGPATASAISLTELAAQADAVVLAQVRDTDYVYRRGFPVRGSAFFDVLIRYKLDGPADLLEVHEEGLHDNECYFPNPTVFEEGRRYLLFLRRDPAQPDRYRGLSAGCAVEILVERSNRYAVRMPVTGIALSDALADRSEPMEFADPHARETDESLSPPDRDAWLAAGWLAPTSGGYVYTRGVDLGIVRRLIDPQALEPAPQAAKER